MMYHLLMAIFPQHWNLLLIKLHIILGVWGRCSLDAPQDVNLVFVFVVSFLLVVLLN